MRMRPPTIPPVLVHRSEVVPRRVHGFVFQGAAEAVPNLCIVITSRPEAEMTVEEMQQAARLLALGDPDINPETDMSLAQLPDGRFQLAVCGGLLVDQTRLLSAQGPSADEIVDALEDNPSVNPRGIPDLFDLRLGCFKE